MTDVAPEVSGPTWRLAPDNPARLEACRLAVEDARRRADAYAGALGVELGAVVAMAEAGIGGTVEGRMLLAKGGELDAGLPVEPGDIDVGASVDVVYRLERRGS